MSKLDARERIDALEASGILRRKGEDRLITLCMAAVEYLSAAASHVNIITATHQVHVASYPPTLEGDLDIKDAGCPQVVIADAVVSIPDGRLDPLACHQPWVAAGILSYLGIPIRWHGQTLGSFCVVDTVVREWSHFDVLTLSDLARRAEETIDTFED